MTSTRTTPMTSTALKGKDPPVTTLMMLPVDLMLSCLARISTVYYPILSLVSKSFHSLLNSPELYKTRSLLGRTESCLYVCFRSQHDWKSHWFTLCRRPHLLLADSSKMNKLCDNMLVPLSSLDSPFSHMSGVVAVGSNIYAIGNNTRVLIMESHSHTWCEAPSMHVAREFPSVCVLDNKIYVTGGCKDLNNVNWMEVFDTKKKTWEFVPSPSEEIRGSSRYESVGFEGNIWVLSKDKYAAFKQHKGRWRAADLSLSSMWSNNSPLTYYGLASYCVIENMFYCVTCAGVSCYDFDERIWRYVKGIEELQIYARKNINYKLIDYGGKMAVLWEEYVSRGNVQKTTIWCAEITLERCQRWEICGRVEWFGVVFTSTKQYELRHGLATSV